MKSGKITIGNVCFLLNKTNSEVLLLKRAAEPMKNMYTGVGGKTGYEEGIHQSCIREVEEETGYTVKKPTLVGVLKTLNLDDGSSWILFVYRSDSFKGTQIECPEGVLEWVSFEEIYSKELIGFIETIIPYIISDQPVFEGTITHNSTGKVISCDMIPAL